MSVDDTAGVVLPLALLILALLLFILRRLGLQPKFISQIEDWLQAHSYSPRKRPTPQPEAWKKLVVATKVELSIARSKKLRILGELAILIVIAFFVAEILTNTRFVRDEAFIWILIGLPTCFLLGRFWWRKYR